MIVGSIPVIRVQALPEYIRMGGIIPANERASDRGITQLLVRIRVNSEPILIVYLAVPASVRTFTVSSWRPSAANIRAVLPSLFLIEASA